MTAPETIESCPDEALTMTTRQRLIVILLLGANFMLSSDFSILNVALPIIGKAVGLGVDDLPWLTTTFALSSAGLSLLFGRLGDLYGRRCIFLAGLLLLALASLLGGLSTSSTLLLTARTLQGVATAMTAPAALALLITTFADERQRARVLGWSGALLSGGFTFGALAGGMLVGALSWRCAFLINVPVAVVILVLTPFAIPAGHPREGVRLDVPGAASVTLALFATVFGMIDRSLPLLVLGLILFGAFFQIERRSVAPLVAIEMLAHSSVRWGNLAALTIFSMEAGLVFLMTLYMQEVLHLGPVTSGLIFGVPGLSSVAAGIMAGRIIERRGAHAVLLMAMLVQGGLTAPLILLGSQSSSLGLLIPALFIGFFGHITAVVAATVTATSDVPDTHKGLASGLVTTSQRVAVTIGIPALGTVMTVGADLMTGIRLALAADVVLTLAAVLIVRVALNLSRRATDGQSTTH